MQETNGERQSAELAQRVARLEAELAAQGERIEALRVELWRTQQSAASAGEYVLRPRKPAYAPPPPSVPEPEAPATPPQHGRMESVPVFHAPVAPAFVSAPQAVTPEPPPFRPPFVPMPSMTGQSEAKPAPQRSLENRIGSQWFSRLGILAILIGVAYFLKLAIDNHWIHPSARSRVVTGLLLGAGVLLWSERFRRKGYGAFSYALKAIGSGTLYLALWASFHLYHVLPSWAALLMMVAVTLWNAYMAWAQDAELLAAYALIGGFATPGLLGSGGNHAVFLFSYLLAMDLAVLLLVAKKPWQRLLLGSFPATIGYFIGWYTHFWSPDQAGMVGLFVLLLSAPMIAVALLGKQREDVWEGLITPVAAAGFLSLAMYSVLQDSGRHAWLPWMAVAFGALYLLLMRVRRNGVAEAVHLALAITFLTIAIPLKAEGRWITVGWLAEGTALMWVAARVMGPEVQSRVRVVMRWMASAALTLGVGESVIFWAQQSARHAFWNGRFATELAAVAALAITAWLARNAAAAGKQREETDLYGAPRWATITTLCMLGTHVVAALIVVRELGEYWGAGQAANPGYRDQLAGLSSAAFISVYGAVLLAWLVGRIPAEDSRRTVLRGVAAIYLALGFVVLLAAPIFSGGAPARVLLNERVLFEAIGIAALLFAAHTARRTAATQEGMSAKEWTLLTVFAAFAVHLLVASAGLHEIDTYWTPGSGPLASYYTQLHAISMAAFLMVYGSALQAWTTLRMSDRTPAERTSQQRLAMVFLAIGWLAMIVTPIVGDGGPLHVFWNERLALELVGLAALAVAAWLSWKHRVQEAKTTPSHTVLAAGGLIAFNLLALLVGVREILTYFGIHAGGDAGLAESFTISAWLMLYAAGLLAAGFWRRKAFIRWQGLILLVFTIGKVFLYDLRNLSSVYRVLSLMGLGVLLMTVSFAYQKDWLGLRDDSVDHPHDEAQS